MFDRLIESDSMSADFKPRRRYFVISTLVVGVLFISAVVISIYAADIGLGNDSYELSAIIAPVQPLAEVPEQPRPHAERTATANNSENIPTRIVKQQEIDKLPISIPPISVDPNRYRSLTEGPIRISKTESEGSGPIGLPVTGDPISGNTDTASGTKAEIVDQRPPKVDLPPPPPARPRSLGVVNGIAIDLPKPPYPAAAIAVNAQGKVDVQITIDERGTVVSARAVDGPALLRQVSEHAALKAKFKPTLLSNIPVKATGIIVYNFTRN